MTRRGHAGTRARPSNRDESGSSPGPSRARRPRSGPRGCRRPGLLGPGLGAQRFEGRERLVQDDAGGRPVARVAAAPAQAELGPGTFERLVVAMELQRVQQDRLVAVVVGEQAATPRRSRGSPPASRFPALVLELLELADRIPGAAHPDIGLDEVGVPLDRGREPDPVFDLEAGAFLEGRHGTLRMAERELEHTEHGGRVVLDRGHANPSCHVERRGHMAPAFALRGPGALRRERARRARSTNPRPVRSPRRSAPTPWPPRGPVPSARSGPRAPRGSPAGAAAL